MNIKLRKIKKADAKYIAEILSNKKMLKTLDPSHPFPMPVSYVENKIPIDQMNWKKGRAYKFVILNNRKIVGQISLYNPNKSKNKYEIGYFVSEKFWNKGIATKAIQKITNFGFDKLKISKLWANPSINNPASSRALEKAGFKLEKIKNKQKLWSITR